MIETLIGVISRADFAGMPVEIIPSSGLISILGSLPSETRIGIEYTPILSDRRSDGTVWTVGYWEKVEKTCQDLGLRRPVHLDNLKTCNKGAKLVEEVIVAKQNLGPNEHRLPKTRGVRELREALFRAETEADYVRDIIREDKILANISRLAPSVVITDQNHADTIMLEGSFVVGQYLREELTSLPYPGEPIHTRLGPGTPNLARLTEKELLVRQYLATTQDRVTPQSDEQKPDYTGTFDPGNNRFASLFKIFITKKSGDIVSGTIKDTVGDASFTGRLRDGVVDFRKVYTRLLDPGFLEGEIEYVGRIENDGTIIGTWRKDPGIYEDQTRYPFYANPGDNLRRDLWV